MMMVHGRCRHVVYMVHVMVWVVMSGVAAVRIYTYMTVKSISNDNNFREEVLNMEILSTWL